MIKKKTLSEEVAALLQEQISLGHYKVNDKLPIEPELMKHFGVGRSTIREAIKILANSGLLSVQQGVGTFIAAPGENAEPIDQRLKRAKTNDLDDVRQLLEMKITEKAAINRTESDIAIIKIHLEDRKKAFENGNLEQCIDADINFHIAIAEASKNEILADLYKTVSIHLKNRLLHLHSDLVAFIDTQAMHEQILKSIIAGDPKKAWNNAAKLLNHISK